MYMKILKNSPYYQAMKEFFNPPEKIYNFQPPSGRSSNIFGTLTSRPLPYCWVKNDQPLATKLNIAYLYMHNVLLI